MIRRILFFVRLFLLPHVGILAIALITGVIVSAASGLGIPLMVKFIFPVVFYNPQTSTEVPELLRRVDWLREAQVNSPDMVLMAACASLPLVFLVRGLSMWLNSQVVTLLGIRISSTLRTTIFRKVLSLPIAFLEKRQKGDIMSRVLSDTNSVQTVLMNVAQDLFKQPITCVSALSAFLYLLFSSGQGWLFLVNALLIGLAAWPVFYFGKRVAKKTHQALTQLGQLTAVVQQNLETMREVRAYGMEQRQIQEFSRIARDVCRNNIKIVKYQRALIPLMEVATSLALAFLLVRGRECGMELSDFLALSAALFFTFDSMKKAGNAYNRLNEAQAALQRVEEVLLEPDTMSVPECPAQLPPRLRGDITFRRVSFEYEPGKPVLREVDLHIPAGQIVGLVGASGAGKTTFASLIPRFYDVTEGALLIDGIDVRDMRPHDLREQLALVGQQALLFAGTIRDNIALGRNWATEAEVQAAAEAAAVKSFLSTQPKGMDTMLGEGGNGLSGGQRQRVAIARAFVKNAPILILDEATASLDARSERDIQQELESLSQGRTTLIVAHRFSTIRHAHRILVFDQGRVVGDGSHEELYATCGIYKELYDRQGIN
ncbi:MAG: ABC transporter ATP-binding protein [Akkermansiaceae bacterium]|nr:ABC transporter ATP-binding protein [Akkermansiaceae bacterium]